MSYSFITSDMGETSLYCSSQELWIPTSLANRHYQEVLDAIIAEGADCFEGDIPQDILDAAEAKQLLTDS